MAFGLTPPVMPPTAVLMLLPFLFFLLLLLFFAVPLFAGGLLLGGLALPGGLLSGVVLALAGVFELLLSGREMGDAVVGHDAHVVDEGHHVGAEQARVDLRVLR